MTRLRDLIMSGEPVPKVELADLSQWDRRAYDAIVRAADLGYPAPTAEELQEICGCSLSTTVDIIGRLMAWGHITVERYQRARRITITATGKATAPVKNKAPHWRTVPRPRSMAAVPASALEPRKPDIMREIMSAARAERMELQEFMIELAWAGWLVREASIAGNE